MRRTRHSPVQPHFLYENSPSITNSDRLTASIRTRLQTHCLPTHFHSQFQAVHHTTRQTSEMGSLLGQSRGRNWSSFWPDTSERLKMIKCFSTASWRPSVRQCQKPPRFEPGSCWPATDSNTGHPRRSIQKMIRHCTISTSRCSSTLVCTGWGTGSSHRSYPALTRNLRSHSDHQ